MHELQQAECKKERSAMAVCAGLSSFFSIWFDSIKIHLLRVLPTAAHLNWGLISSKRHILALMGDEPCGLIEGLIPLMPLLPVPDLIQSVPANFHQPPLFLI